MTPLDWIVLVLSIGGIIGFGLWKSRGSKSVDQYLLAGKSMPWYAMGLSIMATQASAVTFIATTGQAYVDGMRFVQFYLGLPIAMVLLSATAVPIFQRSGVYTAYEYLERRFDTKTRTLASIVFLVQRIMGVGFAMYAPALVLSVIFGWPDQITTLVIGAVVVIYTTTGGIPAVTWTDVLQMSIIFLGLVSALVTVFALMPHGISVTDAVYLAGYSGKLNAIDLHLDWNNRYNIWSGLLGGTFLFLGYFGCDQSQVQRYLTGKSVAQSRLSLLFNAMAKIPMQFFILFVGAMVFVFFLFERPPMLFQKAALQSISSQSDFNRVQDSYNQAWEMRKQAAMEIGDARRTGNADSLQMAEKKLKSAQKDVDGARTQAAKIYEKTQGEKDFKDTNYIFLSFVTTYLPHGLIGLVIAVIFAAAMSSSSGELNSLATVSVIDIYKRHFAPAATDSHYLFASRLFTVGWGMAAVAFAQYGRNLGSLVEAVNRVGSLFYPTLLGAFVLAFFFPRVKGSAAFWAMLGGEVVILLCARYTPIAFLWYNLIGAVLVVILGILISPLTTDRNKCASTN